MPQWVNPQEVEKQIAVMEEALRKGVETPGGDGSQARAMLAIMGDYTRWHAGEVNRDVSVQHQVSGLLAVISNIIASFHLSLGENPERTTQIVTSFFWMLMPETIDRLLIKPGDENVGCIEVVEGGHG